MVFGSDSVAGASTNTTVSSYAARPSSLTWVGGTYTFFTYLDRWNSESLGRRDQREDVLVHFHANHHWPAVDDRLLNWNGHQTGDGPSQREDRGCGLHVQAVGHRHRDGHGQGDNRHNRPTPPLTGVSSIASDGNGDCALLSTGGVQCWGYNGDGELGNGTVGGTDGEGGYDTPQAVTGMTDAVSITSDGLGNCALLSTGSVDCWGDNYYGELGNGTVGGTDGEGGYDTPQVVTGISNAASVTSDGGLGDCALLATGAVHCWGYNSYGQLGNGTTGGPDGKDGYDSQLSLGADAHTKGGQHSNGPLMIRGDIFP